MFSFVSQKKSKYICQICEIKFEEWLKHKFFQLLIPEKKKKENQLGKKIRKGSLPTHGL
jgi:hypothetical protein